MADIDQLAAKWGLTSAQTEELRSADQACAGSLSQQLQHIGALITDLFPRQPELQAAWPQTPNRAFDGIKPIDIVLSEGWDGAMRVREYLIACSLR